MGLIGLIGILSFGFGNPVNAQFFSEDICEPIEGTSDFAHWVDGWCLQFTNDQTRQYLSASTFTSDNYLVTVLRTWDSPNTTFYTVRVSEDGDEIFQFFSNRDGLRYGSRGNIDFASEFLLEFTAALTLLDNYTLPLSEDPFAIASTQPSNTCWVSDEIYVPIGVEYDVPSEPAFITGETSGNRVNLRVSAGTEFDTSGYGLVGDAISIIGQAFDTNCDTWAKVHFPISEHEAWIHSRYVEMVYGRGWWD